MTIERPDILQRAFGEIEEATDSSGRDGKFTHQPFPALKTLPVDATIGSAEKIDREPTITKHTLERPDAVSSLTVEVTRGGRTIVWSPFISGK